MCRAMPGREKMNFDWPDQAAAHPLKKSRAGSGRGSSSEILMGRAGQRLIPWKFDGPGQAAAYQKQN